MTNKLASWKDKKPIRVINSEKQTALLYLRNLYLTDEFKLEKYKFRITTL